MAAASNPHAPGEIVDQWNLVRVATQDDRFSRGDLAVLVAIIQRYWPKYDNGWATVDVLTEMSGISRRQVIRAVANLQAASYVEVLSRGTRGSKVKRGRGTVFRPNFALGHRYRAKVGTSELGAVDGTLPADFRDTDGTPSRNSGATDGTPSYLPLPAHKAEERVSRDNDPAAPSAPLAGAPEGTTAGPAGLEELWLAFGVLKNRAAARAAYERLAPTPEFHAELVARAKAWRQNDASIGTEPGYRVHLHTWLTKERYTEDLPTARAERAAKVKKPSEPRAVVGAAIEDPAAPPLMPGVLCRIVKTDVSKDARDNVVLAVTFQPDQGGKPFTDSMVITDVRGQEKLSHLTEAVGLATAPDNSDDFLGGVVVVRRFEIHGRDIYRAANDNLRGEASALQAP